MTPQSRAGRKPACPGDRRCRPSRTVTAFLRTRVGFCSLRVVQRQASASSTVRPGPSRVHADHPDLRGLNKAAGPTQSDTEQRISRDSRDQRSSRSATGITAHKRTDRRLRANVAPSLCGSRAAQINHSGKAAATAHSARFWTSAPRRLLSGALMARAMAAGHHGAGAFATWPAARWAAPSGCTRPGTARRRIGTQPPRPPRSPGSRRRGSGCCSRCTCLHPARTRWPPGRPAP